MAGSVGCWSPTFGIQEIPSHHRFQEMQAQKVVNQEKRMSEDVEAGSFQKYSISAPPTHLKYEFHDELNIFYVKIINGETEEVVKEIPPKKLLDMFAAMADSLGLLIDKKV